MKLFGVKWKTWYINKYIKIEQNGWFHLLPSILLFNEHEEHKWTKIHQIEIGWFHWEIQINFEGSYDQNED